MSKILTEYITRCVNILSVNESINKYSINMHQLPQNYGSTVNSQNLFHAVPILVN